MLSDGFNPVVAAAIALAAGILVVLVAIRARRTPKAPPLPPVTDGSPSYREQPLESCERTLETLIARGTLVVEPATAEDRARAQIPAHSGPVFRRLAGRYRSVRLAEVDITVQLHGGAVADDALGGWRLAASPDEIDVRLAPQGDALPNPTGDLILDATWSPRSSHEVAVHSTIVHFLVRAAVGDRQ